jgi:site-specific DNA recombinase
MAFSKSVGIWIRVSTEDQARGESPEHHEKRARFYAESEGWKVKEVCRLGATSGKSVIGLPETQTLLPHTKSHILNPMIFLSHCKLIFFWIK